MITKAFVALLFVTNIDDTLAGSFPQDVIDNADNLNDSDIMTIGKDQNSFKKIFQRLYRICKCTEIAQEEATEYNFDDPYDQKLYVRDNIKEKIKMSKRTNACSEIFYSIMDIMVNIWYYFLFNLHILVYNYFGGFIVIIIQAVGFYA